MNRSQRRGAKVYGKRALVPAATAAAIFTSDFPPLNTIPSSLKASPIRHAFDDVTNSLSNLRLNDQEHKADKQSGEKPKAKRNRGKEEIYNQCPEPVIDQGTRRTRSATLCSKPKDDLRGKWLEPLTREYERSGAQTMIIRKWADILDEEWGLEKIAESSYAEVYKVSNSEGTSVLKVMALKPPTGPGSQRETAVDVKSVVSEVLIMNMMAEIPGFLEFKGAHIIEGKPPNTIRGAYDAHAAKSGSEFPKPGSYHKDQLFLALELGDAGTDIEHFSVTNVSQIWDIFFGVVIALSHGEELASFEHRDLHEGNVCVRQKGKARPFAPKQRHKFDYSGLEVTLLDYTLSRATQGDVMIFRDLENDPEIFKESTLLQHQMYRRMRIWALFRSHGLTHASFDKPATHLRSPWADFTPYTNVIWISYLFNYTINKYTGVTSLAGFLKETKDLRDRLHPDRSAPNGGFTRASDILAYCVTQGWIHAEDLVDANSSSVFS